MSKRQRIFNITVTVILSALFVLLGAFVFHWPVEVVFVIILLDEFVKVPLCLVRYKSRRWLRNVTRNEVGDV